MNPGQYLERKKSVSDLHLDLFQKKWKHYKKVLLQELAEEFLRDFTFMNIGPTVLSANKNITQQVVVCSEAGKQAEFLAQMESIKGAKILVFTEKKVTVDRLERLLRNK
jgi:superfamily II DNA/RNA helicase